MTLQMVFLWNLSDKSFDNFFELLKKLEYFADNFLRKENIRRFEISVNFKASVSALSLRSNKFALKEQKSKEWYNQ